MASRFYKLTYYSDKKLTHAVINLFAVARMERCEKAVKIIFTCSPASVTAPIQTQYLHLIADTEKECEEIYNGIENAMNLTNKLA
jgi:hypothetical protein